MSPAKEPRPDDPLEIVGVVLDRPMDDAAIEEMARCFIEEYALMGWGPRRILGLFRRPYFAGAHAALQRLGEDRIVGLVEAIAGPVEAPHDG